DTPGAGFGTINIGHGSNIIIRNNWFHDQQYNPLQVGIIGGSITDNTFERIYPHLVGLGDAIQLWGGEWGSAVSTNVLIEDNTITFNDVSTEFPTHGIRLRPGADPADPGVDAPNIHINNNNFIDGGEGTTALAVLNQGTGTLDATLNWWGTTDGDEIAAMVSGDVDFIPCLSAEYIPSAVDMDATYTVPVIGISVAPSEVSFGEVEPGTPAPGNLPVIVTNEGTVAVDLDATIENELPASVYTGDPGLTIGGTHVSTWAGSAAVDGTSGALPLILT
ncbi:unnamed protein product, partial [marine sediment metagenome]